MQFNVLFYYNLSVLMIFALTKSSNVTRKSTVKIIRTSLRNMLVFKACKDVHFESIYIHFTFID